LTVNAAQRQRQKPICKNQAFIRHSLLEARMNVDDDNQKRLISKTKYDDVDDVKKEIENVALLRSQVSDQIDQMQSANPDASGIGLAPEPSQSGGNAAATGQPAQQPGEEDTQKQII
jgi:(p)ppGpp synthase/HD superfamily hydrolase